LFETTDFCFSLFTYLLNPEIEALNPEPGDLRSKPGDSGSNPETPGQTRRVGNPSF